MSAAVRDAEEEGLGPQVHLLQTKAHAARPSSSPGPWAKAESAILAGFEAEALREHQAFRSEGVSRIYTALRIVLFFVSLFLLCGLYEGFGRWRHWARFRACQAKIQRVHRSLLSTGCKATLCPYCLEFLSNKKTSSQVVFLCGHSFHVRCMNDCYRHMEKSGLCPVCEASGAPEAEGAEAPKAEGSEANCFILRNLRRRYPDFISEDCVQRWASCHTELWLSELRYPSYRSLLQRAK